MTITFQCISFIHRRVENKNWNWITTQFVKKCNSHNFQLGKTILTWISSGIRIAISMMKLCFIGFRLVLRSLGGTLWAVLVALWGGYGHGVERTAAGHVRKYEIELFGKSNEKKWFGFFCRWDSFPLFQILNDYLRTDGEILHFTNPMKFILRLFSICRQS